MRTRLVVVGDFDLVGITALPSETNPVLIVDPNAMLAGPIAPEAFQPVARWHGQFSELPHSIELGQLPAHDGPKLGGARRPRPPTIDAVEHVFRGGVGERPYHGLYYKALRSEM